jgi:hypothetical protein
MFTVARLLLLVIVANAVPLLAYDVFHRRWAWPVDFGRTLSDGRRLFGSSKTLRGIALSLLLTPLCAAVLGLPPATGLTVAAGAMAGDLISSFTKRRMGLKPGSQALGIDQIPEALIPLLLVRRLYGLTHIEIACAVAVFVAAELVASRFLFKIHLREHPY